MSVASVHAIGVARHPSPSRFVVLDDHPLFADGLIACLQTRYPAGVIVYSGSSLHDAVGTALRDGCDCAIVDLDLGMSASSAEIITAFSRHGIPLVAMTERATTQGLEASLIAGACAYVSKQSRPEVIGEAVGAVLGGEQWMPTALLREPRENATVALSTQERRVLVLYGSGMTQDAVARRLGIASSTVKHYLDRIRAKYSAAGIPSRTKLELHQIARDEGLLP